MMMLLRRCLPCLVTAPEAQTLRAHVRAVSSAAVHPDLSHVASLLKEDGAKVVVLAGAGISVSVRARGVSLRTRSRASYALVAC